MTPRVPPRSAVAIGGGHGLARSLAAVAQVVDDVTAIVSVADDGGSSGRLRRELGVQPPGDLRMAVRALAGRDEVAALLDYRFRAGELAGHSVGNLLLVALADVEGGLVAGLDRLMALLQVDGRVLPCTTADVVLHGTAPGGGAVRGQVAVATTPGVDELRLEPEDPVACAEAVVALDAADLVVLGPGSVCTSVVPNLLVPGIAEAVRATPAPVVLVGNLDEQPGEGEGRDLADHVRLLAAHTGVVPDVVVADDGSARSPRGRPPLAADAALRAVVPRVVPAPLVAPGGGHDVGALAAALRVAAGPA